MILAAGRGERMRPLTDTRPKPLLEVGGKPLIIHLIESLSRCELRSLVINHAHLGEKLVERLGDGREWGVTIQYSPEARDGLETGGGIRQALALLDSDPFVVVNGDIWTDYPFSRLPHRLHGLAHLVLVDNPAHHPGGDFCLRDDLVSMEGAVRLTYSGIAVLRHALFQGYRPGKFPLAPLLREAMEQGLVTGEYYGGSWVDVGSPQRLEELRARVASAPVRKGDR